MSSLADAIGRAAPLVDVPGAPLSLLLDRVDVATERAHLHWSFPDPSEPTRLLRGRTTVLVAHDDAAAGRAAWAQAQLDAAHRFKREVDSDALPGVPYTPLVWSVDEAWQALQRHLSVSWDVEVMDGRITLTRHEHRATLHLDPAAWADYLNHTADVDDDADGDPTSLTVPTATRMDHGLPLWAADELSEAIGAWGPDIRLVDGELVGIGGPRGLGGPEGTHADDWLSEVPGPVMPHHDE